MKYLIRNEFKKFYLKKTVYIFIICLTILYIAFALFTISTRNDVYGTNWKEALLKTNNEVQKLLEDKTNYSEDVRRSLLESIILNEYMVENNINPNNTNFKNFILDSKDLSPIIFIFLIIMFSSIIAEEYAEGKIKLLLIRPYKRWKIIVSKWVVSIINSVIIWGGSFIISIITGMTLFGSKKIPFLKVVNGVVVHQNQTEQILMQFWTLMLYSICLGTLAFLIACITNKKTVSTSIGLATYFLGGTVGVVLTKIDFPLRKYEFFTLINSKNLMNIQSNEIVGVMFAIFAYITGFLVLSIYFFQRNKKMI